MNEEEIEAIQILNNFNPVYCGMEEEHAIETILNLVDKQQEEIGKLEGKLKEERDFNKSALETLKECVHKDTIKAKIEEYSKKCDECNFNKSGICKELKEYNCCSIQSVLELLKELLGE